MTKHQNWDNQPPAVWGCLQLVAENLIKYGKAVDHDNYVVRAEDYEVLRGVLIIMEEKRDED